MLKAGEKHPKEESLSKKYTAKNVFLSKTDSVVTENTVRVDDLQNKFDFPQINEDMSHVPAKKAEDEKKPG